jgi:hypothetical protein
MSRHDGDLTNIQWANRLGKPVVVMDRNCVAAGPVIGIGVYHVIVGTKRIPRCNIKTVVDK